MCISLSRPLHTDAETLKFSLDGQNIENVTEHRLLGLIVATNFDDKPRSNTYAKVCLFFVFFFSPFLLSCNISSTSIPGKNFYNAHIKPHIDYASVVWDGCGEVYLKLKFLHRRAGKLILPDPSLSTEQKMSALGLVNLPQQLTYNKGVYMH